MNNKDPLFLRQIIMDHYTNPQYKGLTNLPGNLVIHEDSESCIDNLYLGIHLEDKIIKQALFDGVGCAISTASSDIMAQEITGKTIDDALFIINNYLAMLKDESYDETKLNDLIAFINVSKQPNRIRCATIGVRGFLKLLLTPSPANN